MKIDLKDLEEDSSSLSFRTAPGELELGFEGADFAEPVEVELNIRKSGDSYFCTGVARTETNLECSRCLELYSHPLKAKLDFLVKLGKEIIEIEYPDQAGQIVSQGKQFVAIDNLVKEAILLNLPFKPLCSEECRGLCSVCGVNLNVSSCRCKKEKLDPRWEKLKDFLKG
jgi:uncharacterized protein